MLLFRPAKDYLHGPFLLVIQFFSNHHFGRRHGELPELNRQKTSLGDELGNRNSTPVLRHVSQHALFEQRNWPSNRHD
jgi:hypothetical protein